MGIKIGTDDKGVLLYRKDKTSSNGNTYATYFIKVSSKSGDEWVSGFIDVVLPKGKSVENKTTIYINNAFYIVSEYTDRNNTKHTQMKLYIQDFETDGNATPAPQTDKDGFVNIPEGLDEDLPFARTTR